MKISRIVEELKRHREGLDRAIAALSHNPGHASQAAKVRKPRWAENWTGNPTGERPRRRLSRAGRAAIRAAQQKRRAREKREAKR